MPRTTNVLPSDRALGRTLRSTRSFARILRAHFPEAPVGIEPTNSRFAVGSEASVPKHVNCCRTILSAQKVVREVALAPRDRIPCSPETYHDERCYYGVITVAS